MSDILEVLPDFDTKPYSHLFYSLGKNNITINDLITGDPKEIARRCPLPSADVAKLCSDVIRFLQSDVRGNLRKKPRINPPVHVPASKGKDKDTTSIEDAKAESMKPTKDDTSSSSSSSSSANGGVESQPRTVCTLQKVKTLDPALDKALGGGFQPGHISEVVGESAAGKTQLVLGLLLSVQLPPPEGLGKSAMYISTEANLNTKRLLEMLDCHPRYRNMYPAERPSMDHVHTTLTNSLEAQEHVLRYQLPVAVERFNIGLIVIDSVAANFRAEHGDHTPAGLRERALELRQLGSTLRQIAIESNAVVIVTNQVSDRFDTTRAKTTPLMRRSQSPASSSSPTVYGPQAVAAASQHRTESQSLAHQQRFFTGWGDRDESPHQALKTPALGLIWANQISARIVLKLESERQAYTGGNIWKDNKKKRSLAVVFAPWIPPTDTPVPYEISKQGIVSLSEKENTESSALSKEYPELLNPEFWATDDDDLL
ncbi:uncharacterized protein A1O9_12628 [Exophiala aquamarina CBS 119918]|uniref:RecA family profile 1 domain-containing protein n=1 Tax=Exophiala aquamarina CBS 119918 TaxID=1182545 RepID=A0A072NWA6_9EURO|nr:uncharacterized protein A1O9_12628 [Exophiala aquamarina CBS 119918]KEF51278.1 hypothetical protein A1O9_12628 [Exophiala aquamarina CBS 119918]